jgi:DNA-directed RNA polymerase subunit F
MKAIRLSLLFFSFFIISVTGLKAQTLTPQQQEYEKNKVQIFTVNERDNLLNWFAERAKSMKLSEAKEDEYTGILIFYFVKMSRLDDKDQANSKEEILQKMDKFIVKQNAEVKKILTKEQYKIHIENFDKLIQSIKKRIAETNF